MPKNSTYLQGWIIFYKAILINELKWLFNKSKKGDDHMAYQQDKPTIWRLYMGKSMKYLLLLVRNIKE